MAHWAKLIERFDDHIKVIAEEYDGYDVADIEYIKDVCETIVALHEAKMHMHDYKTKTQTTAEGNPRGMRRGLHV